MRRARAANKLRRRSERGFSLLEVLVALAIMALSLGVLYQSIGSATRGVQIADRTERAGLWARSLLARWPERGNGGWNESGGTLDGFGWRVSSAPLPGDDGLRGGNFDLYEVEIVVGWQDGEKVRSVRVYSILPQYHDQELAS